MEDAIMNTPGWVLVEKGRVEGHEKGRVKCRAGGRLAAAREILADLVLERAGRPGWSMGSLLAAIPDEAELRRLARVGVKASSPSGFERELRDALGRGRGQSRRAVGVTNGQPEA